MQKLKHHFHSFKEAWLIILKNPTEHLINIMVLALVITMCAAGISLNNSLSIWQQNNISYPKIVLYLDSKANQADINNIEHSLNSLSKSKKVIANYQFISKQQALSDLQQDQSMKEIASDVIDPNDNPLPDTFVINTAITDSNKLEHLKIEIGQLPMIDNVQLDMNYANKVSDLIRFANRIGIFTQALFIIVLCLVIYNMIRLQMMLKSDAIQVSRLIGASDSFIMRPLIHYAVWQLTLSSALALLGMKALTNSLNGLFLQFNSLFGAGFKLAQIPIIQFVYMWLILVVFTIFSVFLAVRWVFRNTHAQ